MIPPTASSPAAVSVVIPVYNRETLIAASVESVLAQTFPDHEVVVVDDGSTDRTAERIMAYAEREPRLRYVRQANGGPGAARNRGIREARAAWIAFLDSDDRWMPDKLANAMRLAAGDPRIDFVHTNYRPVPPGGGLGPPRDQPPYERLSSREHLLNAFALRTSTVMLRRSLLDRIGGHFYTDHPLYEDYHLFWRAVIKAEGIGYVPSCDTLLYRTDPGLARRVSDETNTQMKILAMSRVHAWIRDNGLPEEYAQIFSRRIYREYQMLFPLLARSRDRRDLWRALVTCSSHLSPWRAARALLSSSLAAASPRR